MLKNVRQKKIKVKCLFLLYDFKFFSIEIDAKDPATAIQRYSSFKDKIDANGLKNLFKPDEDFLQKKQKLF